MRKVIVKRKTYEEKIKDQEKYWDKESELLNEYYSDYNNYWHTFEED